MALYWPEARMAVECAEVRRPQGAGDDAERGTLVVTMRPEQAEDPEFVEAMRLLVMMRTLAHERETLGELFGSWEGRPTGEPDAAGTTPGRFDEAERRFEARFLADRDAARAAGDEDAARRGAEDEDSLEGGFDPRLEELLDSWGAEPPYAPSPLVQVVVRHCDELVVGA